MNYEGDIVRLMPLVRGFNDERGVVLFVVWCAIEQAGDWGRIFYETPDCKERGDLIHWINYIARDDNPSSFITYEDKKTGALAGITWFNNWDVANNTVHGHIWVAPDYRGKASREIVNLGTRYAHEVLKLDKIITINCYPAVRNLMLKCGWKQVDEQDYDVNGETMRHYQLEHAREDYVNG